MAFKEMKKLRTLIIRDGSFPEGPKHLPNSLRVLEWRGYPSPSLPFDFHPENLVILQLPSSRLKSLNLRMPKKEFVNMRVLNCDGCQYLNEIPDVCGVPNLEELSFQNCHNLIKIHDSVGFLDKLKILDAGQCSKLKSFPHIKLTSLVKLQLSYCPSLENFPEILGKMENVTYLSCAGTPIKELPFSIQNLTGLELLELKGCGFVRLPSSIFVMRELRYLAIIECEGLLLPKDDEVEEQMSSMDVENTFGLQLKMYNMSDEFLLRGLSLFANVKSLYLSENDLTILPACIKEFYFLTQISLYFCENLREIRGIPPNLEMLYVKECSSLKDLDLTCLPTWTKECCFLSWLDVYECKNLQKIKGIPLNIEVLLVQCCTSLKDLDFTLPCACTQECHILSTFHLDHCENLQEINGIPSNIKDFSSRDCQSLTSECRSMLLDKELHEAGGYKEFRLPGTRVPEWFEHCINGSSISFWFRNKFPAISLCFVVRPSEYLKEFPLRVYINDMEEFDLDQEKLDLDQEKLDSDQEEFDLDQVADHMVVIFDQIKKPFENEDEVLLENVWKHVVCTVDAPSALIKQIGIHVFRQGNNMEDIQFTNPPLSKEGHT